MSRFLPSDPNFLLNYLEGLPSDESDSEFDGYVDDDDVLNNSGDLFEENNEDNSEIEQQSIYKQIYY